MKELHPNYFFDLSHYRHKVLFENCEYPWEALKKIKSYLEKFSLGKIEINIPQGVYLVNPQEIAIGKGTVIEPGAYIKGPCIIGENCTIRHGAYLRGDLIVGDSCVIGHDTEVKHSIFLNEAHAAHFAYVGDSILGNHVNLGAGTKCANLKFDEGLISIHFQGKKIPTNLRKLGAILGDKTQMGCNSVANPGTVCGQEVQWYPCVNFGGFVPSKQRVKAEMNVIAKPY